MVLAWGNVSYGAVRRDLNSSVFDFLPLASSLGYHRHARLVNMSLLCAIYWHHITWFVYIKVFQNSYLDFQHCNTTSCSFYICLEKWLSCSTQTHTDTRMEFTQRNEAVHSYWKQTTTGDGEERERHTDRGIILYSSSTASLSLPSPCWAWQLSAGSRSICLSQQLSDTQSTWFLMP